MISFIIPAHDEERFIGATIDAVRTSAEPLRKPYEIVVAADACTDATESIVRERGARVEAVNHRQIAATRNAGARVAIGDLFFFIDADTLANPEAVRACVEALEKGAVGGGCAFRFDRPLPWWGHLMFVPCMTVGRWVKIVGGCFLFCTREAFGKVGGFDERMFAAEELVFLRGLRRVGRVVIPKPTVITSGRKLPLIGLFEVLRLIGRALVRGPKSFRSRDELDIFYGQRGRAARSDAPPN